jgi:hypothetical protein
LRRHALRTRWQLTTEIRIRDRLTVLLLLRPHLVLPQFGVEHVLERGNELGVHLSELIGDLRSRPSRLTLLRLFSAKTEHASDKRPHLGVVGDLDVSFTLETIWAKPTRVDPPFR